MADESDVLFKEIEEDLRQDRANLFWTDYGKYIVGAAVAVVVAVGSFQGWKSYDLKTRQAAGEKFAAAQVLVEEQKADDALKAFAEISKDGGGYGVLARFKTAALHGNNGDLASAIGLYMELADDSSLATYYKDMAVILGALVELDSDGTDRKLLDRVVGLNDGNNFWRHSAREVLGLNALQDGKSSEAAEFFKAIAEDATAPQTIKARASEMLLIING